ncbi:phosphatidylinositol-binding protein scs2 [Blastocladiella emersonii ATCC 22665]|nr:phosphatidylinositol-binding protein scs2 [Blastocladiella emersonii ATCC 22665]
MMASTSSSMLASPPATPPVPPARSLSGTPPSAPATLALSRRDLDWPVSLDATRPPLVQLTLTHRGIGGDAPVLYKFKTNAPHLYRVRPSAGRVTPGGSATVYVQCADLAAIRPRVDNILVQTCRESLGGGCAGVGVPVADAAIAEWMRGRPRDEVAEQVLPCVRSASSPTIVRTASPVPSSRRESVVSVASSIASSSLSAGEESDSSEYLLHQRFRSVSPQPNPHPYPHLMRPATAAGPGVISRPTSPLGTGSSPRTSPSGAGGSLSRRASLRGPSTTTSAVPDRSVSPGAWPAGQPRPRRTSLVSPPSPMAQLRAPPAPLRATPPPPSAHQHRLQHTPAAWLAAAAWRAIRYVCLHVLARAITVMLGTAILVVVASSHAVHAVVAAVTGVFWVRPIAAVAAGRGKRVGSGAVVDAAPPPAQRSGTVIAAVS